MNQATAEGEHISKGSKKKEFYPIIWRYATYIAESGRQPTDVASEACSPVVVVPFLVMRQGRNGGAVELRKDLSKVSDAVDK